LLKPEEFQIDGENWAYITVGTGVGVGLVNTKVMRGAFGGYAGHPEGGHIM
jgi:predicted NBD/HSP70 family sugar kinase